MPAALLVRDGTRTVERPAADLSELRDRPAWLDITDPTDADLALIADELGLHALALEDAQQQHERPKIDQYEGHYFIVFYPLESKSPHVLEMHQLSIFVVRNALVTVHRGDFEARQTVEKRWRDGRLDSAGALLHALLDTIVDGYFPIVDSFSDRLDLLEGFIVDDPSGKGLQSSLKELFLLKRDLLRLRHHVAPEREVLTVLARDDLGLFDRERTPYFQDVYDHVVRVAEQIDTYRELTSNVIDAHLAAASNRLNEVMKVLTSIATVLLVLSVITSFFGMNFDDLPFSSTEMFWGAIVAMVVSGVVLTVYFQRRGWL